MKSTSQKILLIILLIKFSGISLAIAKTNSSQTMIQSINSANIDRDTTIKTYLALGDSYTIGESVPSFERYPVQTTRILNEKGIKFQSPEIIATTGWTAQDLQNAINNYHFKTLKYDLVTLLIGVNNQYQGKTLSEYKEQFAQLLQKSIELAGGNALHVFVISIPDYSVTPFAKESNKKLIANEIDSFNEINKKISEEYKVNYINITGESRKASADNTLVASDGLHYSGKEYAIWSAMLATAIEKIFK